MLKKIAITTLTALALATLQTPAHAGSYTNGVNVNGIQLNGFGANGIQLNGFGANGIQLNGFGANGTSLNGFGANGIALQGVNLEHVEGGTVVIVELPQGIEIAPAGAEPDGK